MYPIIFIRLLMSKIISSIHYIFVQYALRINFRKTNIYVFQDLKPIEAECIARLFSFLVINDIDYSGIKFIVNRTDSGINFMPENQIKLLLFQEIHPSIIIRHILCYFGVSIGSLCKSSTFSKSKIMYLFDSDPIEFKFSYTCGHTDVQRNAESQVPDGIYALNIENPTRAMIAYREEIDVFCSEAEIQDLIERALSQ